MARTITINSITAKGDVSFTMAGMPIAAMNATYKINGLPVSSKAELFQAIKEYLIAHAQGIQSTQAPTQGAAVASSVGVAQDLDQALTPGT